MLKYNTYKQYPKYINREWHWSISAKRSVILQNQQNEYKKYFLYGVLQEEIDDSKIKERLQSLTTTH